MKFSKQILGLAVSAAVVIFPMGSGATNGYFQIGYSAKSISMGGASVANPQDTLAAGSNPAGMAHVGEGWDLGLRLFSPIRDGGLTCAAATGCATPGTISDDSGREQFLIPSFGYTKRLNEKMYAGISVYGNGGMNTHYDRNIFDGTAAAFFGLGAGTGAPNTGPLGVDLVQALIAPTLTYQVHENHTLGLSVVGAVQRFSARGLGNFAGLSSDPGSLTNRRSDFGLGAGVRVGWLGKLHPDVTVGATYASKIYMTKFEKYSGLFAGEGSFDIPANFAVGLAVRATPKLTVAVDVQRILYNDVDTIANPGPSGAELAGMITPDRLLGASNGMGFGWESTWNFKIGAKYQYDDKWAFSAGYNHGQSPIPEGMGNNALLFNILAPGIVENHVTGGISYSPGKHSEWTVAYMHAFHATQNDPGTAFFGSPGKIAMHQNAVNISYARKF